MRLYSTDDSIHVIRTHMYTGETGSYCNSVMSTIRARRLLGLINNDNQLHVLVLSVGLITSIRFTHLHLTV